VRKQEADSMCRDSADKLPREVLEDRRSRIAGDRTKRKADWLQRRWGQRKCHLNREEVGGGCVEEVEELGGKWCRQRG
jgi:hypothetical protein